MSDNDLKDENHRARSDFIRTLVQQHSSNSSAATSSYARKPPRKIVQYWDNPDRMPDDVGECIDSWGRVQEDGIERLLFDKDRARSFIDQWLGVRHRMAFDRCYHPAMQSDYFRLCYIFVEGGCYIDVDDAYGGGPIEHVFSDGRLKLQPLCYDVATSTMVPPSRFTTPGANTASWIFYFNNNPLIASKNHPLVDRALAEATLTLEKDTSNSLPEIQSTAGPGNLTKSLFDAASEGLEIKDSIVVLRDWENIANTVWDLSYRNDARNWRLSNRRVYQQ